MLEKRLILHKTRAMLNTIPSTNYVDFKHTPYLVARFLVTLEAKLASET